MKQNLEQMAKKENGLVSVAKSVGNYLFAGKLSDGSKVDYNFRERLNIVAAPIVPLVAAIEAGYFLDKCNSPIAVAMPALILASALPSIVAGLAVGKLCADELYYGRKQK